MIETLDVKKPLEPRCSYCQYHSDCDRPQLDHEGEIFERCKSFKSQFTEEPKPEDVAKYIFKDDFFVTTIPDREMLHWNDGIYNPNAEFLIEAKTQLLLDNKVRNQFIKEVIGQIQRQTYKERQEFDKEPYLLSVENGVLDLKGCICNEKTPNFYTLIKIPVLHDEKAECPEIMKFIDNVVHPAYKQTLLEYLATCLVKNYQYHNFAIISGPTDAGKTTFGSFLKAFFGEENTIALTINQITERPFMRAQLYNKMLNIGDEKAVDIIKQIDVIKKLTGNGLVTEDVKHVKNGLTFVNWAKFWFLMNAIPYAEDLDDAFLNRWLPIMFPNTFLKGDPRRDDHILEKITKPEELSGFLNVLLKALKDVMQRGYVYCPFSIDEKRDLWNSSSDPYYKFVEECIIFDMTSITTKADLYTCFIKWVDEKKLPTKEHNVFSREIAKHLIIKGIQDGNTMIAGKHQRTWAGLRLVTDEERLKKQKTLDDEEASYT